MKEEPQPPHSQKPPYIPQPKTFGNLRFMHLLADAVEIKAALV
jgi:hypothetical protein